ncbi:MAG: DUF1015 domain-containing protein [Candidatus Thorarchaeota archaeon]|jgi:uncharacterized protein (DUF1015 family)
MVRVIPFRAFRYDQSKVGDLGKVVAPPYDIIKGKKVDELQSLSEYSISWVIKNKPQDGDTSESNQYTRAGDLLTKWMEEGILTQDEKDAFYVYGQNFTVNNQDFFRFGFIGLIHLEDFTSSAPNEGRFAGVLQHEETLPKDIQDRLSLCRATMAQLGQIFVIYPDHEGNVDKVLERCMKESPVTDITDDDTVRHRLWIVDDVDDTKLITEHMDDKYVIIADGHHRYKTALALSKENPELESVEYRMLTFVNVLNPGLVILPTHRIVQNLEEFSKEELLTKLDEHFVTVTFDNKEEMFSQMTEKFGNNEHSFGLYLDDGRFYSLTLKNPKAMNEVLPDKSPEHRGLDVAILHSLILDGVLGIDREKLAQGTMKGGGYVVYVKGIGDSVDEAIKSVESDAQAVFFMNPTRIEEVEAVSRNIEVMPQKSTFFYPKVWTGFTINKL